MSRNNDVKRLQRSKLWRKKTIATGKAIAVQVKAKEESFGEAGITETTDSTFLATLLEQQQRLIEYERLRRSARKTKRALGDEEGEDTGYQGTSQSSKRETTESGGSVRTLSQKLNSDLQHADVPNSATSTAADMWSTPFKLPGRNATVRGELGATGSNSKYQGPRQPMKLEALSIYKQGDKLDPVQWFKVARVKLKNQASLGILFSEEGAIAAIMDRTEVGSTIATWYQAQTNPDVLSNMTVFKAAFTRRFASGRTVEAELDRCYQKHYFCRLGFILY